MREKKGTTKIEWTNHTWNPFKGCGKISKGCENCYAEKMAKRLAGMRKPGYYSKAPFAIHFYPERISDSYIKKWKPGDMVFVESMGDIFHTHIIQFFKRELLATYQFMIDHPQFTFQILTKRPDNALEFFRNNQIQEIPRHIWVGVSVEDKESANMRIPLLLQIPCRIHFVSAEPLLGPIYLVRFFEKIKDFGFICEKIKGLDWVICGAETGHGARKMDATWAYDLQDQCKAAGVPFFMKQFSKGYYNPVELSEIKLLMDIKQFPEVQHE